MTISTPDSVPTTVQGVYDFVHHVGDFASSSGTATSGMVSPSRIILTPSTSYQNLPPTAALLPGSGALPGKRWLSQPIVTGSGPSFAIASLYTSVVMPPDPGSVLTELSSHISSLRAIGASDLGGAPTTEYAIVLKADKSYGRVVAASLGPAHPLYMWIDAQHRIRQVQVAIVYPSPPQNRRPSSTTTSTISYADFGVPVSVSSPPADQVETSQQMHDTAQQERNNPSLPNG